MTNPKNNGNNSLNSVIITKIEKEKCKFYKEIQKLLSKYGFKDDSMADDRLQTLEAENKKLKQELADLRQVQIKQNQNDTNSSNTHKGIDINAIIKKFETPLNPQKQENDIMPNQPTKEYYLHGRACSGKEFEKYLRDVNYCTVYVTLFYKNKPSSQRQWFVSHFTEYSNLNGNINSGYLRGWRDKQITGIKLETK